MEKLKEAIVNFLGRVRGLFSSQLPIGYQEFDQYCERLLKYYGIPDLTSYRQAIATMVMHLPPTVNRVPMTYFAKSVKKAQANQVAFQKIQEFKEEFKRIEEENKKELLEIEVKPVA